MATSSVGSLTAARYVGPSPASTVCTLKVCALMYATLPLAGLATHTTLRVDTGVW